MNIIKLAEINILEIIEYLKNNKVIVAPTETAYGLLANALSDEAVKKVFEIKQREISKELSVFMRDIEMAKKYVEFNGEAMRLAEKYLPGPLTLVLKVKKKMPFVKNSLGIRISNNDIIKKIMENVDFPVTATSANIANEKACYSVDEIKAQFTNKEKQPDLVIDGGKLNFGCISTVIDLTGEKVKILRQGDIRILNIKY
ncbi:MAG: L-threonylcarbamoyladenylate synthase [Patescibacteria group bacterium]|jgi:L-threonylcarbamoyladenylate synthase